MELLSFGESRVAFLPAIRGPPEEGVKVRRAIEEVAPEAVALTVGREDLEGLISYDGSDAPTTNWEEELYVAGLEQWGAVRKPPPCFVEAVRTAKERNAAVRALDFSDDAYTEAYVTRIGTMDLLWHTKLEKKARAHRWLATTPEEFVLEFDRIVNDPESYAALEAAREAHIAKRVGALAGKHRSLLAVVEYERAPGVRRLLDGTAPRL